VNTLACRQYHARRAAQLAPPHCSAAGPFGGGVCGLRCDAFCALALAKCNGAAGAKAFASLSDCTTACATFGFNASAPETPFGPTSGDTLNCREYHLQAAYANPAVHCAHIGFIPEGGADGAVFPCQ
jgi:hypothetical protein